MTKSLFILMSVCYLIGCTPSNKIKNTDEQFLHRSPDNQGRSIMQIAPPPENMNFTFQKVGIDTVHIRKSALNKESNRAAVELLVKGYLSDGCSELHEAKQVQDGQTVRVEILARRPTGTICTMAIRPFRFYLMLNDAFPIGNYILALNETTQAFKIDE